MDIYLNGKIVKPDAARVHVQDAGLQHAVGLFETFNVHHGKAFRLDAHLRRLATSAEQLGLARELDTDALATAVQTVIDHNELDTARVRLTVTAGDLSLVERKPAHKTPEPTVAVVPAEPTRYDPAYFDKGITVLVAPSAANPFDPLAGHKTLSYWARLRTLRQAATVGAGEAIWLNISNHLASGAVSNLFLVKDGALLTPFARGEEMEGALPAPVLPGVTRAAIIELAEREHVPVHRRMLSVSDLLEADEAFLTNSSWYVLPVTKVEKQSIADGKVGELTTRLREALLALVEAETKRQEDE